MRFNKCLVGLAITTLLIPLTWAQNMTVVMREIAPTGTLRAVINLGNPILARKDGNSSEPTGVSVDLAQALAQKLNVPLNTLNPATLYGGGAEGYTDYPVLLD